MNTAETEPRSPSPMSSSLDVFLLGAVELGAVVELQDRLRIEVEGRADKHGTILVCEHPPSVSIGTDGSFADVLADRDDLISRQIEIRWMNRSGGAIVHAPGQLAVYVTVPLERLGLSRFDFEAALESCLITTAANLKVTAIRAIEAAGAICPHGQFGFVGTDVREGISSGGLYLNVSLPRAAVDFVRWNESDVEVTSLSSERSRPIAMTTVRESLIRHVSAALGYEDFHLFTGHPTLHRTSRKVYVFS